MMLMIKRMKPKDAEGYTIMLVVVKMWQTKNDDGDDEEKVLEGSWGRNV